MNICKGCHEPIRIKGVTAYCPYCGEKFNNQTIEQRQTTEIQQGRQVLRHRQLEWALCGGILILTLLGLLITYVKFDYTWIIPINITLLVMGLICIITSFIYDNKRHRNGRKLLHSLEV